MVAAKDIQGRTCTFASESLFDALAIEVPKGCCRVVRRNARNKGVQRKLLSTTRGEAPPPLPAAPAPPEPPATTSPPAPAGRRASLVLEVPPSRVLFSALALETGPQRKGGASRMMMPLRPTMGPAVASLGSLSTVLGARGGAGSAASSASASAPSASSASSAASDAEDAAEGVAGEGDTEDAAGGAAGDDADDAEGRPAA